MVIIKWIAAKSMDLVVVVFRSVAIANKKERNRKGERVKVCVLSWCSI